MAVVQHYQQQEFGPPPQVRFNFLYFNFLLFYATYNQINTITPTYTYELYLFQVALSAIGYRVGHLLAERLTKDRPPMIDQLDVLKWVCKELWVETFKKSVDNLRTNHRGTYVLRDTQFRWTLRLSQNLVANPERIGPNELAANYLLLPCALIRGALAALGLEATVTADATTLPQCDFTVVVHNTAVTPPQAGTGLR